VSAQPPFSRGAYDYLTLDEVIEAYTQIMERTGQAPEALRSRGALEGALARAVHAYRYARADLVRQAALMAMGISQTQPFVDGNKRAAFAVLDLFLRLNGYRFVAVPGNRFAMVDRLAQLALDVAERAMRADEAEAAFETWLRDYVQPLP
jgi:death-on-curing protein